MGVHRALAPDLTGLLPVRRVYAANDTWTKPSASTFVGADVEAVGGGGGGGGAPATTGTQSAMGGSGASGVYAKKWIPAHLLGSTEAVTVGAGGIAGLGSTGAAGGPGGTSSFGAHCSANGGGGATTGTATTATAVAGGGLASTTGVGDIVAAGSDGANGKVIDGTNGVAVENSLSGASFFGGARRTSSGTGAGGNGQAYGAGGSGATNRQSQSARDGGVGSAGAIIVTEYYAASIRGDVAGIVGGYAPLDSGLLVPVSYGGVAAWTSYTPALTNGSVGNGSLLAKYQRIGAKTLNLSIAWIFGTTSSISGGDLAIGLPAGFTSAARLQVLPALIRDFGTAWRVAMARVSASATSIGTIATESTTATVNGTIPITWANGDEIIISGAIEIA